MAIPCRFKGKQLRAYYASEGWRRKLLKTQDKVGKMWQKERKEHPTFTNKQINQIVADHLTHKEL